MAPAKHSFRKSVTNRILAMKFAEEFIPIFPLYTIMFGDRGGVSAAGIGTILATGFALAVVFEIPTGIIADKVSRKYIILWSILVKLLALGSWLGMPYFWGYMLGSALFALGIALESGALQAYLYGTLGEQSQKTFGKFWARVSAMVMMSYTFAYIFTTLLGVNYPLLITLSMVACVVAVFICLLLPRDNIAVSHQEVKPKIFKSAITHIVQSKQLLKLLLSAIIVVALAEVIIELLSLYYKQVGITTRFIPIIMALGNVVGAGLFWTLHSWESFLNKQKLWLMFGMTLLFVASWSGGVIIASAGMLVFTRFLRVLQVQFESSIQHLSNDEARATISSIGSFAAKLAAAAIVALVGIFAVDNIILRPLRIALVAGALLFSLIHLVIRYRQNLTTATHFSS